MGKACDFCQIGNLKETPQNLIWNTVLFQTANFVAVPTIGSLVEGWLLIATKRHYICMGALDKGLADELCDFKRLVTNALQDCYGDVATFEHGPSQEQLAVGCGVDHAHLHIVPTRCSLRSAVAPLYDDPLIWNEVTEVHNPSAFFHAGKDYLYVEQENDGEYILANSGIKSQSFRRVIAQYVGVPDHYNWREYPCFDKTASTVQTICEWKLKQTSSVVRTLG